jgi:hypothetical protein
MALAAPPSGGPWSVVAAVTGAAEESCTTALLLADGDINHAAELILSGVVVPVVTAVVTADSTAQKAPRKAAAAEKDRRLNLRPPSAAQERRENETASLLVRRYCPATSLRHREERQRLPPNASYTSLINRSNQPRCMSNILAGRLILAMLMQPRLGTDSAAALVAEQLSDVLRAVGEHLRRAQRPTELFVELERRSPPLGGYGAHGRFWRHDGTQDQRLAELITSCDVDGTDAEGFTPLYRAASRGDAAAVEAIHQGGANLNGAFNRWRFTPLMEAARNGDVQMVELLLELGASKEVADARGRTALQIHRLAVASRGVRIHRGDDTLVLRLDTLLSV